MGLGWLWGFWEFEIGNARELGHFEGNRGCSIYKGYELLFIANKG